MRVETSRRFIKSEINHDGGKMVQAYCVKCKAKGVEMQSPAINKTARGGFMAKGKCGTCGTTMCAMMSEDNANKAISSGEATKAF